MLKTFKSPVFHPQRHELEQPTTPKALDMTESINMFSNAIESTIAAEDTDYNFLRKSAFK